MSIIQKPSDGGYFVKSLAKGIAIIESFDNKNSKMTLTEVAKKVGITRAAARRFLLTLEELGYAEQVNRRFALTAKILNVCKGFSNPTSVWEIAQKHMQLLVDQVDEACSGAILEGYEIKYVVRIGTPHRIMSVVPYVGTRFPAHLTSTGRAILAFSKADIVQDYLANADYKKYTEFSIDNPNMLKISLDRIKTEGYVILNQELEMGLRSIAIPLFDANKQLIGALTVGTHISRVTENRLIQDILPSLKTCAHNIKQELQTIDI